MKVLESAENYLEAILMVREEKGVVRAIDIVNKLGFSKPSVSVAMKNLEINEFITRDGDGFIKLTESGEEIAKMIYERHNLLTSLFVKLGVSDGYYTEVISGLEEGEMVHYKNNAAVPLKYEIAEIGLSDYAENCETGFVSISNPYSRIYTADYAGKLEELHLKLKSNEE